MEHKREFSKITPEILELSKLCFENSNIDPELYGKYDVKRGLRDVNGKGVLTGLTEISDVNAFIEKENGERIPIDGQLYYRGYEVEAIVDGFIKDDRFGFEEVTYLLLFGQLPNAQQLDEFRTLLAYYRSVPMSFVRDIIMKSPSKDIMNSLARSVLTLYSYDSNPDDTSLPNVLRQCIQLISLFPILSVYSFQAYGYFHDNKSLFIHNPQTELSTAENILYMLRPDSKYTKLEAKLLDMALVLHAEHGGGNNSTFTTHVVTSSGTDTYSAIAAALGSLKGPKHGGANIKVVRMFEDIKAHVKDYYDDEEIGNYITKILHKEAFDHSGLVYGIGHAIYSISDPRARVFKKFVERLSNEKGRQDEFHLYNTVERLAAQQIAKERRVYKGVSANVDFYSGFVYTMLDLPQELFTPLFAIARISGWSAHRIEELINSSKIIRPAYMNVQEKREYVDLADRPESTHEI
ncbi:MULTISPECIES: citrate/2-methylcitrate synthase [unclassified Ruminococcus]|uniref:citrate/2-methylcitrate synthase n=1 Tax=unclassified Ruminococcus TaxID=2608920 RepID=UPI00210A9FB7|nr:MULTISPECIES: citrate/2-methylcitrate synthase [unclassified Ruminococcus]MCQ4022233.1 citrate synthase [Ruminococcus sp. zg-924]MCQ4115204.1 citrate synthase [Ruminococcus sp. zg-921]